jgi:hypothetical protein
MLSGTDTDSPVMLGLYAGSAIVVFALVAQRLTLDHPTARPTKSEPTTVSASP